MGLFLKSSLDDKMFSQRLQKDNLLMYTCKTDKVICVIIAVFTPILILWQVCFINFVAESEQSTI